MEVSEIGLFNDSLERCQANPKFLDRFYETFIASDKAVAAKFARTDLKRQRMMLKASLYLLLEASGRSPSAESLAHLEHIAVLHDRNHRDIPPDMYELWLDCMIRTVREFDPQCTERTEEAWRTVLGQGISVMQARY